MMVKKLNINVVEEKGVKVWLKMRSEKMGKNKAQKNGCQTVRIMRKEAVAEN